MNPIVASNTRFWDRQAPSYAEKPVPDEAAYRTTLDRVRAHLAPTDRVLELGCGTGSTALALAPSARHILATDASERMLQIARQKAEAARVTNVHFRQLMHDDASLEPEPFDKVMAFNLLHLIADVPAAIGRVASLLVPGGLFISKTPCIGESGVLWRVVIPLLHAVGRAPYVNYLETAELRDHMTNAGLEILETGLYPAKTHSLFIVARKPGGGVAGKSFG